ncbi:hypothetical protein NLN00_15225, partial [Escherichia coli]|uniref:hypothetical protein n=1 Tax=Escherichia coli TaxID=562 RepID=UPI0020B19F32
AVSWQKGMTTEDYIEKCGGLTQKSGISHTFVLGVFQSVKKFFATLASKNETGIIEMGCCAQLK